MARETAVVVEQLRERIRKLEAQPRQLVMGLRTGLASLDAWGAFRLGTGVELCGEEASGRTTLALSLVAAAGREKRLSAWVDGPAQLYPPAAVSMGVALDRLLIARPHTPDQLVWTAMQLLRSGAFTCVVLDTTHTGLQLTMLHAKKLLDAARIGGALLVLVTSASAPAQGFVRLMLQTQSVSQSGMSALRVVQVAPEEKTITPHFEVTAPHGNRAVISGCTAKGRWLSRPWPAPNIVHVFPRQSLVRPKKNFLRDGHSMSIKARRW